MSNAKSSWSKWSIVSLTLLALVAFSVPARAQDTHPIKVGNVEITGLPDDWSHHHLIFSDPGTEQDAIQNGTHEQWMKIVNDPRYVLQQMKKNLPVRGPAATDVNYRAAWTAEATGGLRSQETSDRLGSFRGPSPRDPHYPPEPLTIEPASALKKDWSMSMNSTSATVGANNFPAKYSFSTSNPTMANCAGGAAPDFVVYNTGVAGGTGQASIIAYDNLYVNTAGNGLCTGTAPSVYWAYDVDGYTIETSVVLSADGTQVAFVNTASPADLVLLKWKASATETAAAPDVLAATAIGSYKTCTAPCFAIISFGTTTDAISSPFYDYADDAIYVGDADGNLLKFSNVFLGATRPTLAWTAAPGHGPTTSAVWDAATGYAYSTNFQTSVTEVNASGTETTGPSITDPGGGNNEDDIQEGPIVDETTGEIYLFGEGASDNFVAQVATANFSAGCSSPTTIGGSFTNCGNFFVHGSNDVDTLTTSYSPTAGNGILIHLNFCSNANCTAFVKTITPTISDNINSPETCLHAAPNAPYYMDNSSVPDYVTGYAFYCPSIPAGVTSFTITNSGTGASGTSFLTMSGSEWETGSIATTGYFDSVDQGVSSNNTPSLTATVPTSAAVTHANDLLVSSMNNCGSTINFVPGTGFTPLILNPSGNHGFITEAAAASSSGVQTATASWSGTTTYDNCQLGDTGGLDTWFGFITPMVSGSGTSSTSAVTYIQAGGSADSDSEYFYAGAFDNNFYNTGTGNLYVCGHNGGDATLYQIPITSGAMKGSPTATVNATAGPVLTTGTERCSPVTEIYNNSSAVPYDWLYLGVRGAGAPSGCGGGACVMNVPVTAWQASNAYALARMIVDTNFNIEVVTTAGTSAATEPTWPSAGTIGTVTSDGTDTLIWTSLGTFTFTAFATSHTYAVNQVILDSNGNLERVTTAGTSAGSAPTWTQTFNATTTSGEAVFTEQGPLGINGAPYTGGTSGIIVDNIGTAAATSNIYFSTLGSETCTGGTAGCAVQASQSAP